MTLLYSKQGRALLKRDIISRLHPGLQCNCDLDNWQPEESTGHSWVCRIHKAQMGVTRTKKSGS